MKNIYITNILINSVSHLKNIEIPLSNEKKNLIITGKNGSGKTCLLDALAKHLQSLASEDAFGEYSKYLKNIQESLNRTHRNQNLGTINQIHEDVISWKNKLFEINNGLDILFNIDASSIYKYFNDGEFVLAYYKADRVFQIEEVKNVEKISLNTKYLIEEKPSSKFVKYLVDLKVTEALALTNGKERKAQQIASWFQSLEDHLKVIFDDQSLRLVFDDDVFNFYISINGRNNFDFNTLSGGYSAILDIVVDLIMRMEKISNRRFEYTVPGIVLIDEIEAHLHLELQKNIMKFLTAIFPNIQFIVTTHSPFVVNSLDNVIIYDLENGILVENGLTNVPYKGIVEGYFRVDSCSKKLKDKFERYKKLVKKKYLEDEDFAEISRLQIYLEKIPDYLALDISTEYQMLKLEFEGRNDLE
ncbi:AAA family ATPase [Thomasclavelia sp.]|uniref:AAA family ATPase n=1 Tax=Thomasclavelia sp. TaxID=3025757 RepID=UPI0025D6B8CB|nr:AAA family ATPase [Thomasclavelia sp.]